VGWVGEVGLGRIAWLGVSRGGLCGFGGVLSVGVPVGMSRVAVFGQGPVLWWVVRLGWCWCRPAGGQVGAGSARIALRMVVKSFCQGQRAGIRRVHWRLVRVSRAGI
jgi:hypothetical protein